VIWHDPASSVVVMYFCDLSEQELGRSSPSSPPDVAKNLSTTSL